MESAGFAATSNEGVLTHVDSIIELIINDLEEANDVAVATFFHDGDLFAYLLFETAELVRERRMGRGREIPPAEKIHLLGAWIITFHGLYCLIGVGK